MPSCRRGRELRAVAVAIALLAPWGDARAQSAPAALRLEPGAPLVGGQFQLPFTLVDGDGAPLAVSAAALTIEAGGRAVASPTLTPFAPAPGGAPSAVAVLADLRGLPAGAVTACGEALAAFVSRAAPDAWRGVYAAGSRPQALRRLASGGAGSARAPSAAELAGALAGDTPVPLWDNVKDALAGLAFPELPARRALILVTGGREGRQSRYSSASCLAAADSARVAVYVVLISPTDAAEGAEAGPEAARLRRLADGSGGRLLVVGVGDAGGAVRRLVAVVDGALGARFTAPGLELPAEVTLRLARDGGALAAGGTLRARRALAERGIGRWPALLLVALAVAAAVVVLVRTRFASAGELVVTVDGRPSVHRLPRSGATIGSAAGNTVVVVDRRVSGQHAVLRVRGSGIIVTDLRSTNGTQVNGQPVRTATIGEGDRVLLGGAVQLVYRKTTRPGRIARPDRRGGS
jgi:hypothetical protein